MLSRIAHYRQSHPKIHVCLIFLRKYVQIKKTVYQNGKILYISEYDENGALKEKTEFDENGNIVLAPGKYDFYFKVNNPATADDDIIYIGIIADPQNVIIGYPCFLLWERIA